MKLKQACWKFDEWEYPWNFIEFVTTYLCDCPDDLLLVDRIWTQANNKSVWLNTQSICILVQRIEEYLVKRFSTVELDTLKSFARAASYNWRLKGEEVTIIR